jgi:Putative heavy-metal-binding
MRLEFKGHALQLKPSKQISEMDSGCSTDRIPHNIYVSIKCSTKIAPINQHHKDQSRVAKIVRETNGNVFARVIVFKIMIVTTANDLSGYKITRQLGVVRGITVRSRSVLGNIRPWAKVV